MDTFSSHSDPLRLSLTSRYSDWVLEALDELSDCFLITDPAISGHPIVFASQSFLSISGYAQSEILGKNPRLFQGPETDRGSISQIREAVRTQQTVQIMLVNYRKDGTPHQVLFHMSPVFGQVDGTVVHFFAVQVPIVKRPGTRHGACSRALLRGCRDEVRMGCDAPAPKLFDNVCNKGQFHLWFVLLLVNCLSSIILTQNLSLVLEIKLWLKIILSDSNWYQTSFIATLTSNWHTMTLIESCKKINN